MLLAQAEAVIWETQRVGIAGSGQDRQKSRHCELSEELAPVQSSLEGVTYRLGALPAPTEQKARACRGHQFWVGK